MMVDLCAPRSPQQGSRIERFQIAKAEASGFRYIAQKAPYARWRAFRTHSAASRYAGSTGDLMTIQEWRDFIAL